MGMTVIHVETSLKTTTTAHKDGVYGYLPIRPDMLQFLRWRENLPPAEPLLLPGHGGIAAYLTGLIEMGKALYFPDSHRAAPDLADCISKLRFRAAPGLVDESFFLYAEWVAYVFNRFLYNLYVDEGCFYVAVAQSYAPARLEFKDALYHFHSESGVNDYREFDADIKSTYRLRDHRGQVKRRRS